MDTSRRIKSSMLQITGIFARLEGGQYTAEKAMEDILN
jgi:hypothetical protein